MSDKVDFFKPDRDVDSGGYWDESKGRQSSGMLTTDGRSLINGTENPEHVSGSGFDDVLDAPGAGDDNPDNGRDTEFFDGADGFDTVILPGQQSDYIASLPQVFEYEDPSHSMFYNDQQSAYGAVVVLEDLGGDRLVLIDVERVVFSGEESIGSRKDFMQKISDIEEKVASGEYGSISTQELHVMAEHEYTDNPEALVDAKLMGTKDAAEYLLSEGYSDPEKRSEIETSVVDAIREKHPDIENYSKAEPSGRPVSGVTVESVGYDGPMEEMPETPSSDKTFSIPQL